MTVRELIEADPYCTTLEVVVREHGHGQWIQGYHIGKCAEVNKNDVHYGQTWAPLKMGEEKDVMMCGIMPLRVIKKDVEKAPDYVMDLEVCDFVPYFIPWLYKDKATSVERGNDHTLAVNCYRSDVSDKDLGKIKKELEKKKESEPELEGQMNFEDLGW